MIIAECVETKTCYKPNQKDVDGNELPLGSIEFRIGSHESNLGQVRSIWARPCSFNRRIPLIGEQCILFTAPVNDWSTTGYKSAGFLYFCPINSTDDLVLHQFPKLWSRKGLAPGGSGAQRKADKKEPGYTFPKNPKKTYNLQPFEGDDLFEGRFGQSIRFGSTVDGDMSIYSKKPEWKGGSNTDPITIIRIKKPDGSGNYGNSTTLQKGSTNKYVIEEIDKDDASIYLTTTQALQKLKAGFSKNLDAKKIGSYKTTPQVIINSGRVVVNATDDKLLLIGKDETIVTGKKVLFQSDKYKVDLDDLMDFLKDWLASDTDLASGKAQYSTAAGPTATSTNVSDYIKLQTATWQQSFKKP